MIGQTLQDRYRLDAELGRGGMGVVYRAFDALLEREVAIKVVSETVLGTQGRIRLLHEARATAALNHPNIVTVHDVGEAAPLAHSGQALPYIVMELVEGESLYDRCPQALDEIIAVAGQVCAALEHAHAHGIVHRDLKPENVLLAPDGRAKLVDFGLARSVLSRLTTEGTIVGTIAYLAPELVLGQDFDGRVDLYSLGVMLYELAAGQLPFTGDDPLSVLSQHLRAPVVPPSTHNPEIPPALDALIVRLLSKRPEERPSSAAEVGQALEEMTRSAPLGESTELLGRSPTNLPAQRTPFIGRQAQLAEVRALLARPEVRLLTLTGAGGTGKTRLAIEAATGLLQAFPDGVFFVSLAPVSDPVLLLPALATALEVRELAGRSPLESLQQALRDKRLMLVVDNFEHLLPAAPALTELLSAAPRLKVLVTSRAPLQLYAEFEYELPPMVTPHTGDLPPLERLAEVETVQLFTQRVRAVHAGFCLDEGNAPAVAEICARLEGLPLAIELAAAWARMLTPAEILTELGHGLDFLESERRDVPARQRSMRAVFDYSWRLLSAHERKVLQAASVFRGGFTRQAAERVAGASLRDLRSLVTRSLLQRAAAPLAVPDQAPLEPRYEMHELFRQYAQGKLDECPRAGEGSQAGTAARDRHCSFYSTALEGWGEALTGPRQVRALAELGAEVGNARAAWEWATKRGYVERLDQAMDGLCRFYEWRGRYQEGETACRVAEEALMVPHESMAALAPGDRVRVLAKALIWRAVFAQAAHHVDHVIPLLERGLAHLAQSQAGGIDVRRENAFALWQMADAAYSAGRPDARQWYEQSLDLYRALGDRWGVANVLHGLGHDVLGMSNAFAEGEALARESLAIRQSLGDQRGIAMSRRSLSNIVCLQGHIHECERLLRQSLAVFEALGDRLDTAQALTNLSNVLLFLGKPAEAYSHADQSVALLDELGLRDWIAAMTISNRGQTALWLGSLHQARTDMRAGLAIAQEVGKQAILAICLCNCGMLALADGDDTRAVQLLEEGFAAARQVRLFHTDTCAVLLGLAMLSHGQPDQARHYLSIGLGAAVERGSYLAFLYGLPPAAAFLLKDGQVERAVELYALALQQPFVARSRWYEDVVGRQIAAAAATLPPEVVDAAQARGRVRDLEATIRELVAELGGKNAVS